MTLQSAFIGVDVGGTHTDVQVIHGGTSARGKALTTYSDFSVGVLEAIGVAAQTLGLSRESLLNQCQLMVNATTVVTNAVTQFKGAKVGVLVTAGFRDEFRFAGCSRISTFDDQLQVNVPDLAARSNILEVVERIDYAGSVLIPLDIAGVESAARQLVEERGVEAIAICFLSSYANAAHETAAAALIRQRYPHIFVTASTEVGATLGESRRWTTALLNCFVHKQAHTFLDSLDTSMRGAGLGGVLTFFQGLGGGISKARAREFPLALLGAGPAGGVVGANELAKRMGVANILIGDMGGTSFDTGIIVDNDVRTDSAVDIGLLRTSLSLVDVISVGAGGGSIAWVGERGVPQVGPGSAGSTPGPAAYGRGGTKPTVTDAMIHMGFIDPGNYLGGRVPLHPQLSEKSIREEFARFFDWSVDTAAVAIHDLVVTNMAHAVREVSINKGHDPRSFMFLAYGGTLPMFGMQIARMLDMTRVVIPRDSSVFCAWGVLMSDFVLRFERTVNWMLADLEGRARVNEVLRELIATAKDAMQAEGFKLSNVSVACTGHLQFSSQVHTVPVTLESEIVAEGGMERLTDAFLKAYERYYGEGTAWRGMPIRLVNIAVLAKGKMPAPRIDKSALGTPAPESSLKGHREVLLPERRTRVSIPIHDYARFEPGARLEGPAIIEAVDTTVFVPTQTIAVRDEYQNLILSDIRGGMPS